MWRWSGSWAYPGDVYSRKKTYICCVKSVHVAYLRVAWPLAPTKQVSSTSSKIASKNREWGGSNFSPFIGSSHAVVLKIITLTFWDVLWLTRVNTWIKFPNKNNYRFAIFMEIGSSSHSWNFDSKLENIPLGQRSDMTSRKVCTAFKVEVLSTSRMSLSVDTLSTCSGTQPANKNDLHTLDNFLWTWSHIF